MGADSVRPYFLVVGHDGWRLQKKADVNPPL